MNVKQFMEVLGDVNTSFVQEAAQNTEKKKRRSPLLSMAACLVIGAALVYAGKAGYRAWILKEPPAIPPDSLTESGSAELTATPTVTVTATPAPTVTPALLFDDIPEEISACFSGLTCAADYMKNLPEKVLAQSTQETLAMPTWEKVQSTATHCVRGTVIGIGESRKREDGMLETDVYFRITEYLSGEEIEENIVRIARPFGRMDNLIRRLSSGRRDMAVGEEYICFLNVTANGDNPAPGAILCSEFALFAPNADGAWTSVHPGEGFGTFTKEELAEKAKKE